jgi:hypothetical protein
VYVPGVRNTRRFLEWIRAKSASTLVAQIEGEALLLMHETADEFRDTIATLRSLDESE